MPTLDINADGEYFTRVYSNGSFSTIHFTNGIKTYLEKNHIKLYDTLPQSWHSDTLPWQYTHGLPSIFSGLTNTNCPECGKRVFYYENDFGSKVFFDHAGDTWPKHPCTSNNNKHTAPKQLIKVNNPKILHHDGNTIFHIPPSKKNYVTTHVDISQKKSMCKFYILTKEHIPFKIIIIHNAIAKEIDIIKYRKDADIEYENKKRALPSKKKKEPEPKKISPIEVESKEFVTIKKVEYYGYVIKIFINESNIAHAVKIRNPGHIQNTHDIYIINRLTFPKLLIVSKRTNISNTLDIIKIYKPQNSPLHKPKKYQSTKKQ